MQVLLLTLDKYEPLIYLILAFLGLWVFRWVWRAWREWRESYFGLERELAVRRLGQAVAMASLILIIACSVFIVGTFIIPGLPASALISTPTVDLLSTPMGDVTDAANSTLAITLVPAAPIPGSEGCVPGKIEITSPKPNETVSGKIEIIGTVDVPSMGFYKYEFAPTGSEIWATISADRVRKKNESLGSWFTNALTPGDYQLRLVVTDTQGQALPACVITVRVLGQ